MIPPRSPFSLIQEDLWPNVWLIFASCVMLNCTSRKQVQRVMPRFIDEWHTPERFLDAEEDVVKGHIRPLGFSNRRYDRLRGLARDLAAGHWDDPRRLCGVGEYAARAYEIFCKGELGDEAPDDGSLKTYWEWAQKNQKARAG